MHTTQGWVAEKVTSLVSDASGLVSDHRPKIMDRLRRSDAEVDDYSSDVKYWNLEAALILGSRHFSREKNSLVLDTGLIHNLRFSIQLIRIGY